MEEETVKEVLSETPKPKLTVPKIEEKKQEEEEEDSKVLKEGQKVEISEISDICSWSESVSTTTVTERRDEEEGEVRQRIDRSPAKLRSFSGDLKREKAMVSRSTRRTDPSPARRREAASKPVSGREANRPVTRRSSWNDGQRRDPGESSGRRSRSPATRSDMTGRNTGVGRSPSGRKTGVSPGRVRTVAPPENNRKKDPVDDKEKDGSRWPSTNESIDNPLVSLECFIFL